jgi:DNA-binding transcriptional MocR family regulator
LLAARPELWTTYSLPPGSAELRRLLARRLSARQVRVRPEHLLIANGAMEAMFLALRAVIEPGDVVAVECPTFFGIHDVLHSVGARVLELPGHPRHGIEPERLASACRVHRIKAAVLMPSFANPSGANVPEPERAALARVLTQHRVALIEDDLYGELSFDLRAPTPLSAWLLHGKTPCFLVSSFSKTLLPAGRVGYVVASSPWIERATELKRVTSLATASLPEQLAAECLANGVYDRHLRRMIPRLHQRVRNIEHLVARHFPEGTRSSHPSGGFLVWLELPARCSGERLFWAARRAGIGIVPGSVFSLATPLERFVRLSAGSSAQLDTAIARLGKLARQQLDAT